jgi:general secretion pathway protein G
MVELLVVIVILAVLIALLLPAINAAMRNARTAAVGAEINQLAQALASFKTKYGDYPPSRILLVENGDYTPYMGTLALPTNGGAGGDINIGQLAQRSVAALRKFFPRVPLNTSGGGGTGWYDFNGDGTMVTPTNAVQAYILQGHECLAFFLGGIPFSDSYPITPASKLAMTGFGKDPKNPFTNSIVGNPGYSANRQPPLFEFAPGRLAVDNANPYAGFGSLTFPQIPAYLDTLGNPAPTGVAGNPINFYAYFSAYGNSGFDPNDVNFAEADANGNGPVGLLFRVNFAIPVPAINGVPNSASSLAPNPYTSTSTVPPTGVTSFLNPQSFQVISSGQDGQYGVGGQYDTGNTAESLQVDSPSLVGTTDGSIRTRERDNVTNFHNGKLE